MIRSAAPTHQRPKTCPRRAWIGIAWAVGMLLTATPARAHFRSATHGDIKLDADTVTWRLRIRAEDLAEPLGLPKSASIAQIRDAAPAVVDYVGRRLAVANEGRDCPADSGRVDRDPQAAVPSVAVQIPFPCGGRLGLVRLRYELFFDLDPLHQGFARVTVGTGPARPAVFRADVREMKVGQVLPWTAVARDYLLLGTHHILTGADHMAFLMALLLAAVLARRRTAQAPPAAGTVRATIGQTLGLVTLFTVAHSTTLIGAGLGFHPLSPAVVEPLIALSVALVAAENLFPRLATTGARRRRLAVVFVFGLVHGLGFGGLLQEIGLPTRGLVTALAAFNVGVELGQAAVVAVLLPLLIAAARRWPTAYERLVLEAGSAALAAAGVVWLVLRIVGG